MYSETDGELIGDSIDIQVFEEQKRKKPRKEKGKKDAFIFSIQDSIQWTKMINDFDSIVSVI